MLSRLQTDSDKRFKFLIKFYLFFFLNGISFFPSKFFDDAPKEKKKVPLKLNNFVSICQWPSTDLYNGACDDAGDLFFSRLFVIAVWTLTYGPLSHIVINNESTHQRVSTGSSRDRDQGCVFDLSVNKRSRRTF